MLKVSIVIPTYQREKCIIDLLKCIFEQDYENFEVVVIDQSPNLSGEKQDMIARYPGRLKYFKIDERGRSLAKNYGILFSTGDVVIFCDDDIIVPSNFISTHVQTLMEKGLGAMSCRLVEEGQPSIPIVRPLATTFFGRLINKPYSTRSSYVTSLNGGNMSFRRDVLDRVGFFEEDFAGTSMVEEPDMAYRIVQCGYKLYFDAGITVWHYPQRDGNIAEMKSKRADWFYFYFYNLSIFYLKYGRLWNMMFVFVYCVVLSLKHSVRHRQGSRGYIRMVSGYFNGWAKGRELYGLAGNNKYFTPYRTEKKKYNVLGS